mmetsp:Transcript_66900/g.193308  ORF Transcript_66900/g.193308 Transcript_66900/m.193308 type:complete len:289 (+) Transcript_66900:220-1086(+)
MVAHDVEDAVADGVAAARVAAGARQDGHAHESPDRWVFHGRHRGGEDATESLLHMRHVLRLVAAQAVPLQRLRLRQAQVARDPSRLVGVEVRLRHVVLDEAEALEVGPVRVLCLGIAEGARHLLARAAGCRRGNAIRNSDAEVASAGRLEPLLAPTARGIKDEGDGRRGALLREGQDDPGLTDELRPRGLTITKWGAARQRLGRELPLAAGRGLATEVQEQTRRLGQWHASLDEDMDRHAVTLHDGPLHLPQAALNVRAALLRYRSLRGALLLLLALGAVLGSGSRRR